jgi:hypothetical protein
MEGPFIDCDDCWERSQSVAFRYFPVKYRKQSVDHFEGTDIGGG